MVSHTAQTSWGTLASEPSTKPLPHSDIDPQCFCLEARSAPACIYRDRETSMNKNWELAPPKPRMVPGKLGHLPGAASAVVFGYPRPFRVS